ncbi:hypothetical protein SKAU_G00143800 [Synaphobranchus kaupii]|uniref:Uncharacterized protein n=1 Tax=Synaphobranchus kaupii TaxID=118154 RepID=A0A9Q1FT74_SYNKA|nr:hypothetical protein SKAU_G00143800 [Synaphobranchus kaupii]
MVSQLHLTSILIQNPLEAFAITGAPLVRITHVTPPPPPLSAHPFKSRQPSSRPLSAVRPRGLPALTVAHSAWPCLSVAHRDLLNVFTSFRFQIQILT